MARLAGWPGPRAASAAPAVDEVVVAAADTAAIDDLCLGEVSDDSLRRPAR